MTDCSGCGLPVDPSQTMCGACGALTVFEDEVWRAATAEDPPTQIMPAVRLRRSSKDRPHADALAAPEFVAEKPVVSEPAFDEPPVDAEPPALAAEPSVDSEPPVVVAEPVDSATRRRPNVLVGLIWGAAVALALLVGVFAVGGGLPGLFRGDANTSASNQAQVFETPQTERASAANDGGFNCSPREVAAPAAGRWRLYRAEYGPREGFDYLRLKLRRDGEHAEAAVVSAEHLTLGDASTRYGLQPRPGVDTALVVAFRGPVVIGGPWGAQPSYGALREFRIARSDDGTVHALVGRAGHGCFNLSGGAWEAGQTEGTIDITLEIEKR